MYFQGGLQFWHKLGEEMLQVKGLDLEANVSTSDQPLKEEDKGAREVGLYFSLSYSPSQSLFISPTNQCQSTQSQSIR